MCIRDSHYDHQLDQGEAFVGHGFKKVVVDNATGRYYLQLEGRYLVMSGVRKWVVAAALLLQAQEIEPP